MRNFTLVVAALAWAAGFGVLADEIVLAPVADTSIFSAAPANDLGASTSMAVGVNGKRQPGRGLIRFDLADRIPPGATITNAILAFSVTKLPAAGVASTFAVQRMLVSWNEGKGSGNLGRAAINGETTWQQRIHPANAWSVPGAAAGVEFAAAPSATVKVDDDGRYVASGAALTGDVRHWLETPPDNFGWMLKDDAETTAFTARRVATKEDAAHSPSLTIEYSLPRRPVITRFGRVEDRFELEFIAEAGNAYEVQAQTDLASSGAWMVITNYVAKLITTNFVVSQPLSLAPARFFRVADVGDVD